MRESYNGSPAADLGLVKQSAISVDIAIVAHLSRSNALLQRSSLLGGIAGGAVLQRAWLLVLAAILFVVADTPPASAQCNTANSACSWNATIGSWFNGANWAVAPGPPTSSSTVTIDNGGTANIDTGAATSSNTTIDNSSSIAVKSGQSWNATGSSLGFNQGGGAIIVGETGIGAALTIENNAIVTTTGTSGASNVGTVLVGDQANSSGSITLGNGTAGTALLTTTAPGGSNFYIGYSGTGVVTVNSGGSITGFFGIDMAVNSGSKGSLTINGGSVNQNVNVGDAGVGTLLIENGGTMTSATSATVASGSGSGGSSATVTGTGSTWTAANMTVGGSAQGTLTISNGGLVTVNGNGLTIANSAGSAGSNVTVNGGTLNVNPGGGITVGGGDSGTMLVEGGGTATTGLLLVGDEGFGSGLLTVTGTGSTVTSTDSSTGVDISNSNGGTGLSIAQGGQLSAVKTFIGDLGGFGTNTNATVDGANSKFTNSNELVLGYFNFGFGAGNSTGTLEITNGATATATKQVIIGLLPDGGSGNRDAITVSGTGSTLQSSAGTTYVGYFGSGSLTISGGASVSDVNGIIGYSSVTPGTLVLDTSFALDSNNVGANSVGNVLVTGAGSTWINSGNLIVGDNSSTATNFTGGIGGGTATGTLTIANGGAVSSTGNIDVALNAGSIGTINIGAADGQTAVAPGTISAPAIVFGVGTGTMVFNHTSTNYVFGIPIQGTGSVIVDSGTTVFTATNSYTGATTINGGTLEVDGSIATSSLTTVANGALLTGTGTVGNLQINSGGTFAPGTLSVPGTAMTVAGNLTFLPGAFYFIALNPAHANSATVVGGNANLNGTIDVAFANGQYMTRQFDLLHANSINGTFSTFDTLNLPPGVLASLVYTPTDVFLDLTASLPTQGLNVNQVNVANAIDNFFNNGGALPPGFLNLLSLTGTNLGNALTALDGEDATGAEHVSFQLMNEFLNLMLDPYVDGRNGGGSGGGLGFAPDQQATFPSDIALAYDAVLKAPPMQTFARRWTTWAAGFGSSARTNGDPIIGSNTVTTNTFGYAAGLDYHYSPDTVLGFALAGGGTSWNLVQGLGTGRSDAFLAGVYGVTHQGPAYIGGALAFANNWFTTNRTALGDQLSASFQGQNYAARLEGGYRFAVPVSHNAVGITPYAAIQAQNFHTPAYSETDLTAGGFGLSYAAMNGTDTRSELGARFDDATALNAMPLVLRARAAWAHDWVNNPALNASFEALPGAAGFTVFGAPIPHDSALTSAGAQLFFTPNWSLLAKFDGEFAKASQTYAGTGTLRYTW